MRLPRRREGQDGRWPEKLEDAASPEPGPCTACGAVQSPGSDRQVNTGHTCRGLVGLPLRCINYALVFLVWSKSRLAHRSAQRPPARKLSTCGMASRSKWKVVNKCADCFYATGLSNLDRVGACNLYQTASSSNPNKNQPYSMTEP